MTQHDIMSRAQEASAQPQPFLSSQQLSRRKPLELPHTCWGTCACPPCSEEMLTPSGPPGRQAPDYLKSSFWGDSGDPNSYGEKLDCRPLGRKSKAHLIKDLPPKYVRELEFEEERDKHHCEQDDSDSEEDLACSFVKMTLATQPLRLEAGAQLKVKVTSAPILSPLQQTLQEAR
ncbi:hypothetical protein QTO34_007854 [Cnephaeus nilssonii]|uniref:Uncharacterized protein n=1 Tax=Cnephaeus nilssonii TaxID=3371016 RepID=A0AA40HJ93_CNENI|nr:hypothetical protein QTO34_007854 [Eptesicus nilssonii]